MATTNILLWVQTQIFVLFETTNFLKINNPLLEKILIKNGNFVENTFNFNVFSIFYYAFSANSSVALGIGRPE